MTEVIEVAADIYQVKFDDRRSQEITDVYLMRANDAAIIEIGSATMVPEILAALRFLHWDKRDVAYIIPTHLHLDHAGGAGQLARELRSARVVAHQRGVRHLVYPAKLIEGIREAFGSEFEKEYGAIVPVPSEQVLAVHDGDLLDLGGRELEVLYTPGHASHHIVILDRKTRGLFCGDALGQYFPEVDLIVPVPALPVFDVEMAKESIERMRRLRAEMLLFSHGGVRRDVERLMGHVEAGIDILAGIASEAFQQGLDMEELSKRLSGPDMRMKEVLKSPAIPKRIREGLNQISSQAARALLAYYTRRNEDG